MSLQFEGDGIILDINRSLRAILATLFYNGQRTFKVSREVIMDRSWEHLQIHATFDSLQDGYIISVSENEQELARKRLPPETVQDAEFEIIEDKSAPITSLRQLLPPNDRR